MDKKRTNKEGEGKVREENALQTCSQKGKSTTGETRNRWANVSVQLPDPCIASEIHESSRRRISVSLLLSHINTLMSGDEERGGRVSKIHLDVISCDFHYSMIFSKHF